MTKPSDFIMNTDYLALAQYAQTEITAVFPSEYFSAGDYTREQDFTIPATNGAIDRVLISENNGDYYVGSIIAHQNQNENYFYAFSIFRPTKNTIRVRLYVYTSGYDGFTMPTTTIKAKISSFKAPNIL